MAKPLTPAEEASRGREARDLLRHPAIRWFFHTSREQIFARWAATDPEDQAERERQYLRWQAILAFEHELEVALMNGQWAEERLAEEETRVEPSMTERSQP